MKYPAVAVSFRRSDIHHIGLVRSDAERRKFGGEGTPGHRDLGTIAVGPETISAPLPA
jgi:hypothetical protein